MNHVLYFPSWLVMFFLQVSCKQATVDSTSRLHTQPEKQPPASSQEPYTKSAIETQKFPCGCPPFKGPLFDPSRQPEELILPANFNLLEGPVWIREEGALLLSAWNWDKPTQGKGPPTTILKLKDGEWSTWSPEGEIRSNGLAITPAGQLIAATHDEQAISQISLATRERVNLAKTYRGKTFNAPNDLTMRSDGNIYFSDPSYQIDNRPGQGGITGVYRIAPDGTVTLVDSQRQQPNGIALSGDESTLYVGSAEAKIFRYRLTQDGSAEPPTVFAETGQNVDGMAIDCLGNVYAALHEAQAVVVYNPQGKEIARVPLGVKVTNVAFGGQDQRTLYITTTGRLFQLPSFVPGSPY